MCPAPAGRRRRTLRLADEQRDHVPDIVTHIGRDRPVLQQAQYLRQDWLAGEQVLDAARHEPR